MNYAIVFTSIDLSFKAKAEDLLKVEYRYLLTQVTGIRKRGPVPRLSSFDPAIIF